METIIFEFKQYFRKNAEMKPVWLFSDFVNEFMCENRYYGEDIYNELMTLKPEDFE